MKQMNLTVYRLHSINPQRGNIPNDFKICNKIVLKDKRMKKRGKKKKLFSQSFC